MLNSLHSIAARLTPAPEVGLCTARGARLVDWSATLESLAELGITRVLDLGPGHALAELMRSFRPDIRCYAADGFHTLDGLRNWLASP